MTKKEFLEKIKEIVYIGKDWDTEVRLENLYDKIIEDAKEKN